MHNAHQSAGTVVEVRDIGKRYGTEGRRADANVTQALDHVSFTVARGEFLGIMGPSGSGKSTLLNCLATIDAPTSGRIVVDGRDVTALRGKELARYRRDELGFIFQDANLLDTLTAYENIALALTIQKAPVGSIDARVRAAARTLGIEDVLAKRPFQLSGGQRQRVAAARATVTDPSIVLADEPTGALDSKSAVQLLESLVRLNELDSTILMVTHDPLSASYCSRIVFIKDGRLYAELHRGSLPRDAFYRRIVEAVAGMGGEAAPASAAAPRPAHAGAGEGVRHAG